MTDENVGGISFVQIVTFFFVSFKLDSITHGFKSVQLEDEDASKYLINYLSDDSDDLDDSHEPEKHAIPTVTNDVDVSSLPNSLIITPVPPELFTDQQSKVIDLDCSICSHSMFCSIG